MILKDLALFEEFAEKQRAGRGEAANNFKFGEGDAAVDGEAADETQDDLYSQSLKLKLRNCSSHDKNNSKNFS